MRPRQWWKFRRKPLKYQGFLYKNSTPVTWLSGYLRFTIGPECCIITRLKRGSIPIFALWLFEQEDLWWKSFFCYIWAVCFLCICHSCIILLSMICRDVKAAEPIFCWKSLTFSWQLLFFGFLRSVFFVLRIMTAHCQVKDKKIYVWRGTLLQVPLFDPACRATFQNQKQTQQFCPNYFDTGQCLHQSVLIIILWPDQLGLLQIPGPEGHSHMARCAKPPSSYLRKYHYSLCRSWLRNVVSFL